MRFSMAEPEPRRRGLRAILRATVAHMAKTSKSSSTTLEDIFPGRGDLTVPTSVRFSAGLLKRIDEIAEAKGVTRTEAIEKMLAWAVDSLDPEAEDVEELQTRRRRAGTPIPGFKLGRR